MQTETIEREEVTPKKTYQGDQKDQILARAVSDPISAMRELTKKSLYYFIQYFWPEYSQEKFVPNWHIQYICSELEIIAKRVAQRESKLYDLIINVPPGTTKSATISIFFPIWCWVNWHDLKFITGSYTSALSLESAEYSREVVRSDRFKEIFPELDIKDDKDTKSNFRVVKREFFSTGKVPRLHTGGNRFSTSVGGTLTGFHGHINIVDDPIDPNGAVSETELKKVNNWMTTTLPGRKVSQKVTVTILVMQRLHQNDPTGHLLKLRKGKVKHICLPGEIRNYREMVSPPELIEKYQDDLLDVNRLSWNALDEFLLNGQFAYGSQIGQNPIPLGGGMFKTDKIPYLTHPPDPLHITETVRYWDKAATEGGQGAFTAGVKMCKMRDGTYVVLDVKRGRWSTDDRERIIRQCAEADGSRCKVAVEQEPGSGGKESAEATLKNLAGFVASKDRPTGSKVYRADPYSVQVNQGNVKLLTGTWNKDYTDELENFPNSTYKDQTDASSGAFAKLTQLKKAKVLGRR